LIPKPLDQGEVASHILEVEVAVQVDGGGDRGVAHRPGKGCHASAPL
jgi:hypothetical protein